MVQLHFNVLPQGFVIPPRRFAAAALLASGTLAWFFLLSLYLVDLLMKMTPGPSWTTLGQVLFFGTGILSAILGSLINDKLNRKFLWTWITFGLISTALLAFSQGTVFSLFVCILLGFSLGLGLPSSLAFLANRTTVEVRGRTAGTSILVTFVMAFLAIGIINILNSEMLVIVFLCIVVRSTSFLALVLEKDEEKRIEYKSQLPKPDYRELSFYLFPWIMFVITSVIASNLIPSTDDLASAISYGTIFRYAFIALFGFIWGVIADRVGRKWPIIIGLSVLGIGFIMLGLSISSSTVFSYLAISGVAWGSFLTIYLVIPGDLSIPDFREKFYALGTISPLIIMFSLIILLSATSPPFPPSSFSQILSALLFLSIIPVWQAKETLHESKIQERRMREYTERVAKNIQETEETEEKNNFELSD